MRFAFGLLLIAFFSLPAVSVQTEAPVGRQALPAIGAAQQLVRTAPDSEPNRLSLASLYLKVGQNKAAVETLQEYLQSHPDAPMTLRLLAVAYLRLEDYSAANNTAERALRFGPRDSAGVQVLAMAQLGLQATDSAERLFREALKLNPNSMEANLQLGLLYANQRKNLPEAIRLLEKARSLEPKVAEIYTALGSAFLNSGNPRQAENALETAVTLAPQSAESYFLLATALRQLHADDKAEAALSAFKARQQADADQRAREMRSRADYEEGVNLLSNSDQLDKAYASLTKAASELPTFDPAYYRMAQVSYLKGDLLNALTSIREALKLNPLEPEYYFVLARCLEDTDPRGALAAIEKAVGFRPGVLEFEDLQRELKAQVGVKPPDEKVRVPATREK
jgi:tetratricopeptide (TPR) repeat protein